MCLDKVKWGKVIISAIICGIIGLVLMLVLSPLWEAIWPGLMAEYSSAIFRPWTDPWMSYMYVNGFVFSFFMAILYDVVRPVFKEKKPWKNGVHYGFLIFLLGIPGMLMSYSSFAVSCSMVMSWTLSILIQYLCYGIVIAHVYKK